jgi:hypothetical protein
VGVWGRISKDLQVYGQVYRLREARRSQTCVTATKNICCRDSRALALSPCAPQLSMQRRLTSSTILAPDIAYSCRAAGLRTGEGSGANKCRGSGGGVDSWQGETRGMFISVTFPWASFLASRAQQTQCLSSQLPFFTASFLHSCLSSQLPFFTASAIPPRSVTAVTKAKEERLTVVNSYQSLNPFSKDRTVYVSFRDVDGPAVQFEFARHVAWRVRGQLDYLLHQAQGFGKDDEVGEGGRSCSEEAAAAEHTQGAVDSQSAHSSHCAV